MTRPSLPVALLVVLVLTACGARDIPVPLLVPASPEAAPTASVAPTPTALPALSGRIAFGRGNDIWQLQGDSLRKLTSVGSAENPAWAPDGTLAFDRAGKNSADLWLLADGSTKALSNNASAVVERNVWEMQPDWSPDGSQLVYASDRGRARSGTLDPAVWRLTVGTGVRAQLSGANAYTGGVERPRWRPGWPNQVVYTSWAYLTNNPDAYGQLSLLDVRSNSAWSLSQQGETLMQPSWSPDGSRLAFVRRSSGQDQLWVAPVPFVVGADVDLMKSATLVADGVTAQPAWSPRGDAIAYIELQDGSFELFVQPLASDLSPDGRPRQLTRGLHVDAGSSISWGW